MKSVRRLLFLFLALTVAACGQKHANLPEKQVTLQKGIGHCTQEQVDALRLDLQSEFEMLMACLPEVPAELAAELRGCCMGSKNELMRSFMLRDSTHKQMLQHNFNLRTK